MPMYRVTREIDLEADSPREAAEQALAIHRKSDSIATVFYATDQHGESHRVDLGEEAENVVDVDT